MGNKKSKRTEINREELEYLLQTTNITSREIKHWHKIYMVSL